MRQELRLERINLQVRNDADGKIRLDRFLTDQLQDVSRSRVQSLIEEGHVTLNGAPAEAKTKVRPGDLIEVQIPPPQEILLEAQPLPLSVLYEDDELIVIDKEAGMCVHPAPGNADQTVVNALLHHCEGRLARRGGEKRLGIVHRLDMDTSGCLVAAKTDRAHEALQRVFSGREARKEYVCVTQGRVKEDRGSIEDYLGRNPGDRKKMAVVSESRGRFAHTDWEVGRRGPDFTVVRCRIHTGRTHQIRVHMAYELGHPILGDPIYGKGTLKRSDASRLFLHAWRLAFQHPVSGKEMAFEAPLPRGFAPFLEPGSGVR